MQSLTLHATGWTNEGPGYANGLVIWYRVGGMPEGEDAKIQNLDGLATPAWRVLRISKGKSSDLSGGFESAEDALAALQAVINIAARKT